MTNTHKKAIAYVTRIHGQAAADQYKKSDQGRERA